MEKSTNAAARVLAAIALVGAALVVIVVIASSGGGSGSSATKARHGSRHTASKQGGHRTQASSYVIQTGDTLTAIAHKTGVPIERILSLNPEVDPQILIAGERLKLR